MTPEDRAALIEAGYDPNDPGVQARMIAVERGLALLRARWHDNSGPAHQHWTPATTPRRPTRRPPCAPH
ncbi:hypothetical protein [Nocardia asteroides]|uniref:hypothetical protein n=1 Tax=Nocardia asteroides TaxID=1824 RepID=UPI001E5E5588|nr:hypothetical protein [Nocardia asteroides]UGT55067.1 hypothetical protein LTT85_31520 [Nocardia asteroides]